MNSDNDKEKKENMENEALNTFYDFSPNGENGESSSNSNMENDIEKINLKRELEYIKNENSDLKDKLLRKQAEFDNFRKRMHKEKQDNLKYAHTEIMKDLVTIIDDFQRAIKSSEDSRDFDTFFEGVSMMERQMINILESKYDLRRFGNIGDEYDPQNDEAISLEYSDEYEKPTIIEVYQHGYKLHDRILRTSKVKVGQK